MATSSPSLSRCSGPAYSWLTATAADRIAASLNVPSSTSARTRSAHPPLPGQLHPRALRRKSRLQGTER